MELRNTDQKNKHLLIAKMKEEGIARIQIEYAGYGDSGGIETITAFDLKGEEIDLSGNVSIFYLASFHLKDATENLLEKPFEDAVGDFADAVLYSFFGVWYDNDGGQGSMTLDANCEDGLLHIEHEQLYTATNSFTYDF